MSYALLLIMVLAGPVAQSAQPIITETADSITVEYTGIPGESGGDRVAPAGPRIPRAPTAAELVAKQIKDLEKEISDLGKTSGPEAEGELAQKKAQLETLQVKLERLNAPQAENQAQAASDPLQNLQSRRQAMKSEMRAWRMIRAANMNGTPQ